MQSGGCCQQETACPATTGGDSANVSLPSHHLYVCPCMISNQRFEPYGDENVGDQGV